MIWLLKGIKLNNGSPYPGSVLTRLVPLASVIPLLPCLFPSIFDPVIGHNGTQLYNGIQLHNGTQLYNRTQLYNGKQLYNRTQ